MKPRISITVQDGCVTSILANTDVDVAILDCDVECTPEEELSIDPSGEICHVSIENPPVISDEKMDGYFRPAYYIGG